MAMDIERVNAVLVKAIVAFQEAEIEAMAEASVGGFKIPTPAEVASKGKKKKAKECNHRNKKGDFSSFNTCVLHMTKCKGKSEADAKGLCGGVMFGGKRGGGKKSDEGEE